MKLNNIWFGFILALAMLWVGRSFATAYASRGYLAIGGEVFTIALPMLIVHLKLRSVERERERYKNLVMILRKDLAKCLESRHTAKKIIPTSATTEMPQERHQAQHQRPEER